MHFHQPMVAYPSPRQSRSPTPDGQKAGTRPSDGVAVTFQILPRKTKTGVTLCGCPAVRPWIENHLTDVRDPCRRLSLHTHVSKRREFVQCKESGRSHASIQQAYLRPRFASIAVPAGMGRVEEALLTKKYTLSSYLQSSEDFDR
jgi:hypothetical protein